VPVRSSADQIAGFIGRKIDEVQGGPKYRNPTHTSTFEKSKLLYSPLPSAPGPASTAVVVEGPLDALAVVASAAAANRLDDFWACSANGVAVSPAQAAQLVESRPEHIVIALDGDAAGREGTIRWVDAVCRGLGRPVMISELPETLDPAEWLALHGESGLAAFDPGRPASATSVAPRQAGRELVAAIAARARDPLLEVVDTVVPLSLMSSSPRQTVELLTQVESEMRQRGWDPNRTAIPVLRRQAMEHGLAAVRAAPIAAHRSAGPAMDLL
jgi:DNA primase